MSETERNLKVEEPSAYLCFDDSGTPYCCKLTVEIGEKYIPLYTARILAERDAAHAEETRKLKSALEDANAENFAAFNSMLEGDVISGLKAQLSAANAAMAMLRDAMSKAIFCGASAKTVEVFNEAMLNTQATAEAYMAGMEKAWHYAGYTDREQEIRDILGIDGNTDSRLAQLAADMKYLSLYSSYIYKHSPKLDAEADKYVDECFAAELRTAAKKGEVK